MKTNSKKLMLNKTKAFVFSESKKVYLNMGGGGSKSVETVKSENFKQSSLKDESFSIFNIHAPSGVGGAALV